MRLTTTLSLMLASLLVAACGQDPCPEAAARLASCTGSAAPTGFIASCQANPADAEWIVGASCDAILQSGGKGDGESLYDSFIGWLGLGEPEPKPDPKEVCFVSCQAKTSWSSTLNVDFLAGGIPILRNIEYAKDTARESCEQHSSVGTLSVFRMISDFRCVEIDDYIHGYVKMSEVIEYTRSSRILGDSIKGADVATYDAVIRHLAAHRD